MKLFELAEKVITINKADVPEVQAVVFVVENMLVDWWQDTADRALDDALLFLDNAPAEALNETEEEGLTDQFVAMLLTGILEITESLPPNVVTSLVDSGVQRLMQTGAASKGSVLDRQNPEVLRMRRVGSLDLLSMVRGRITSRVPELRSMFGLFFSNLGLRLRGAERSTWEGRLREALGARGAGWISAVTDVWGYRWYNIGGLLARLRGATEGSETKLVAFNNPPVGPDTRTSSFCRWVHGRVVGVQRARRQLQEFADALVAGDREKAQGLWPLNPGKTAADFVQHFRNAALPPYHFRCRTQVQLV